MSDLTMEELLQALEYRGFTFQTVPGQALKRRALEKHLTEELVFHARTEATTSSPEQEKYPKNYNEYSKFLPRVAFAVAPELSEYEKEVIIMPPEWHMTVLDQQTQ